jgi:hypothetical protein
MTEERAYDLARLVECIPGYRVLEVRRAWSAAVAWQVEVKDRRTGERLLLLDEDQFDAHLHQTVGTSTAAHTAPTARTITCAAVSSN